VENFVIAVIVIIKKFINNNKLKLKKLIKAAIARSKFVIYF